MTHRNLRSIQSIDFKDKNVSVRSLGIFFHHYDYKVLEENLLCRKLQLWQTDTCDQCKEVIACNGREISVPKVVTDEILEQQNMNKWKGDIPKYGIHSPEVFGTVCRDCYNAGVNTITKAERV